MSDCVFCQRIAEDDYIYDTDYCVGFEPLNPVTRGHFLIVPREHVVDALESTLVTAETMRVAAEYANFHAMLDSCNLITSVGAPATQSIRHLHIHVIPRRAGDGLALPWTGQVK